MKKWTITSPAGQILEGEETEKGEVNMASKAGNHGQVAMAAWMQKIEQMKKAGYKVEEK
jgi:hypothetical protein